MHSVGLQPTKLILAGTRTTYQATGDAGMGYHGISMGLLPCCNGTVITSWYYELTWTAMGL